MAEDVKAGGLSPVTDAEAFASMDKDFDLVTFGPSEEKWPHQLNEYVSVEDDLSRVDLFKAYLKLHLLLAGRERLPVFASKGLISRNHQLETIFLFVKLKV